MTIKRFPSLAHWGAFNALVEDGRVIGCEPFAHDPAPSAMLDAIPAMVHSPLRIGRPAIREGWREGAPRTGADRFREVSWDEALALVAQELARVRAAHGAEAHQRFLQRAPHLEQLQVADHVDARDQDAAPVGTPRARRARRCWGAM